MYTICYNKSTGDFSEIAKAETKEQAKKFCDEYTKGGEPFVWADEDKAIRYKLEVYDQASFTEENGYGDPIYETGWFCE